MRVPRVRTGEVASIARDLERWLGPLRDLDPPDDVLRVGGYQVYEDLLRDDRVWSCWQQRQTAVLEREWTVDPGGEMRRDRIAAEQLEEALRNANWDLATEQMLYTRLWGFAAAECIWRRDGSRVVPAAILPRAPHRFRWRLAARADPIHRWELLLRTREQPLGEALPEAKFWTVTSGAVHADQPYGNGLGRVLYWLVFVKRNLWTFWAVWADKFGAPTAVAAHPRSASEKEQAEYLAAAQDVHANAAIALPEDVEITLLQALHSSGGDYEAFAAVLDRAIATAILSETMTTEDGSSRSQAEVHMDVARAVTRADARALDRSFSEGPAAWLTAWNHPGAATPRLRRIMDDPPDLAALAGRDKILADMGWRPTRAYVEETYGVEVEEARPVAAPPPAPGLREAAMAAAAGRPDPVETILAAIDDGAIDQIADELVGPVLDAARDDPDGTMRRLESVYPHLDARGLADLLERLLTVAHVLGRAEALEGR